MRFKPSPSFPVAAACLGVLLGCGAFNGLLAGAGPTVKGSGNVKSESREVEDFQKITIEGSTDLHVEVGPATSVTVEADDNILPLIETVVNGQTLKIGSNGSYSTRKGVRVTITTPSLEKIAISGSGDAMIEGVRGERFDVAIAGSGNVRASGTTTAVSVSVDGSGDVDLTKVEADQAKVAIAGSGDVKVRANDALDASVAGSGDVVYVGNPKTVKKSVAGSGSVRAGR